MSDEASGWTLALDTATMATVAAAVGPDGQEASRRQAPGPGERPGHTRLLLGLAEECLRETGGTWSEVDRVVIGLGPGTFTGIRVGLATGRGIALAAGAQTVGVPTPAALATAIQAPRAAGYGATVLVVQDARRKELFVSVVGPDDLPGGAAGIVPLAVPRDELAEAVAALDPRPTIAVGDAAVAHAGVLTELGVLVPPTAAAHAVDGLALLRAAGATKACDPAQLRPMYVREPDAVPTALRGR